MGDTTHRTLRDLFFIRPLPSRTGDIADFSNTEKQAQSPRQNEKMEKYVPNEKKKKKQDKAMATELRKNRRK